MSKQTKQLQEVAIRYDLHELPTAQHKAGLAGLLLQIESMNDRRARGDAVGEPPEVINKNSAFAEIKFTAASTQAIFDDLYSATIVEVAVAQKWVGKEPKAVREVVITTADGKPKAEKRFIYDIVQPSGPFLARYTNNGKETWHKLWRDVLWNILRGKPMTRGPFNARAEGKPTKEGTDIWKNLLAFEKTRSSENPHTVELAGAILLGAQAVSPESVRFEDRADHAVLLHFWQLAVRVFVPEQINSEGKREFVGYVLAIADISDLAEFSFAYKRWLSELASERRGYRPSEAVISLPAEGSLAFMYHLDRMVAAKELSRRPPQYLSAVEFFQMIKVGNNIKTASNGRVPASDRLLARYEGLMGKGGPKNPLMLAGRLQALLAGDPWYSSLADELVEREWHFFVHSTKEGHRTPPAMINFASDARQRFEQLIQKEVIMPDINDAEAVDRIIYRLVKTYVREKASARMGIATGDRGAWHAATHDPATGYERPAYQEERRHVAQDLFLALRSRQESDFVQYFTATLGSVAQRLSEDQYALLASALLLTFTAEKGENRPRTRDDIKTLTLLALSAHSRSLIFNSEGSDQPAGIGEEE